MTKEEVKKAQVIAQAIDGLITVNKAAELLNVAMFSAAILFLLRQSSAKNYI